MGCGFSAKEYSGAHGHQINFGDLTSFLAYMVITKKYCNITCTAFPRIKLEVSKKSLRFVDSVRRCTNKYTII